VEQKNGTQQKFFGAIRRAPAVFILLQKSICCKLIRFAYQLLLGALLAQVCRYFSTNQNYDRKHTLEKGSNIIFVWDFCCAESFYFMKA
jgi:hypothetical protein